MNRRRRLFAVLLQLAFVATLLMALAPLVSRWQQARAEMPLMVMPSGMTHMMPPPAADAHAGHAMGGLHAHHAMAMEGMAIPADEMADHAGHRAAHDAPAPSAPPLQDAHAGHGEACEYCMMASRLMPWLAVLMLLLPALPVVAPIVLRAVARPRSLRWAAHAARGPPLNA